MNIQFGGILINECNLKFEGDIVPDPTKLKFNFKFFPAYLANEPNKFGVIFEFNLNSEDNLFKIYIEAISSFITDVEINDEFKASPFPKISAPAIAFPYLRTFISNLMLNSGYQPVNLPSVNFVKIVEDTDRKINSETTNKPTKGVKRKKAK